MDKGSMSVKQNNLNLRRDAATELSPAAECRGS